MADKILEKLRIELKNGLNEAVIKNLVDDLRMEEVLNRDETEEILQKTKTRPDQARDLIDGVKVKGSEASQIFFEILGKYDKILYKNLQIASLLSAHLPKASASSSASHESDEQKTERKEYKMNSMPRGLCIIINNENFINPCHKRNGSKSDVASLQKVFTFLGFVVEIYEDLEADEIKNLMAKYSKDSRHGDCFVCCVLSHGEEPGVFGKDEKMCSLKDIKSPFDGVNCPSLIDKPKVFFIQACRGPEMQSKVKVKLDCWGCEPGIECDNVPDEYTIPKDSDFLTVRATVEGYFALRDTKSGSWFIQSLCTHLKDGSQRNEDILKILTDVIDDVSRREVRTKINNEMVDAKMIPESQFTLRKSLIFRVPEEHAAG